MPRSWQSRALLVLLPLVALISLAATRWRAEAVQPVTVILVRHAETAGDTRTDRDPPLSEAGSARAQALARLLSAAGVTHLFASEFQRTQATLGPLSATRDLDVEVIAARDAAGQVKALRALPPGSVAVVAGHSNTVPALERLLVTPPAAQGGTAPPPPNLAHDEYGRLFLVTLPAGEEGLPKTVELRYGDG